MADMKFKFTIQDYQTDAVNSVVNVFNGQPFNDQYFYTRDVASEVDALGLDDNTGYANATIELNEDQLKKNIQEIQTRNNIKISDKLTEISGMGACSLDVEMETGTGKTYVYIKTMFELNRKYGWSKYIVVVPSIAIREGVKKSFETMQDHFMEHYGKKARFFIYNSDNLTEIDTFSQSSDINVMIINIQAFNAKDRKINDYIDKLGGRKPIDVIKANHPIIILDEPQKMGGDKTQKSLKEFNPLFCLNYSATHKEHHDLVYVLDALDAYKEKLVKQIEVKGFDIKSPQGTNTYLYLAEIVISPKEPPKAHIEFEIKHNNSIKRETRKLSVGDDVFVLSNSMEQYKGYTISDIDPISGKVTFTNGKEICAGDVYGDINEEDLRRIQIRETIRSHFEKERELFEKGIKTLSLFFIDKVEKYRKYDEEGNIVKSEYEKIFEEEYKDRLDEELSLFDTPYNQYLRNIDVHETHTGYFSIDKKGHSVDSSLKRNSDESDDVSAYDLIMKDKERLLSLDNPVRFIFSHSALREGWDNPNVFQICTLKHGGNSPTQKRQEVGRGLRLCVNKSGDRQDKDILGEQSVHHVNRLTVIASDGYRDFVSDLQRGICEDLYDRPKEASEEYFKEKTIFINDKQITISEEQAKDIYRYLIKNDYVDDAYHISDKYREDLKNKTLVELPESCKDITEGVHKLIQGIYDETIFPIPNGRESKIQENVLNDNFYKKEFQTLWNHINHKYAYTVNFESKELIKKAIAHIDENMSVTDLGYKVTTGKQEQNLTREKLNAGEGFSEEASETKSLKRVRGSSIKYDLVGDIAKGAKLTRLTVAKILKRIKPIVFDMFKTNPEEFISKAIRLINEQKATMIVEQISYNRIEGTYDSTIFTEEKNTNFSRAYRAKKNVQDYVFADGYAKDGKSIERKFAEDMDIAKEVNVYAKLPKGFSIPTPVGNYSPDWAIVFNEGTVKHIYFIAETKGTMSTLQLRPIEQAKINCAKKLFKELSSADIVYNAVDSYENLMKIMNKPDPSS